MAYFDSINQSPSFDMIVNEERLPKRSADKIKLHWAVIEIATLNNIHQLKQHHSSPLGKTKKKKHYMLVIGMSAYINEDGIDLKAA